MTELASGFSLLLILMLFTLLAQNERNKP